MSHDNMAMQVITVTTQSEVTFRRKYANAAMVRDLPLPVLQQEVMQ